MSCSVRGDVLGFRLRVPQPAQPKERTQQSARRQAAFLVVVMAPFIVSSQSSSSCHGLSSSLVARACIQPLVYVGGVTPIHSVVFSVVVVCFGPQAAPTPVLSARPTRTYIRAVLTSACHTRRTTDGQWGGRGASRGRGGWTANGDRFGWCYARVTDCTNQVLRSLHLSRSLTPYVCFDIGFFFVLSFGGGSYQRLSACSTLSTALCCLRVWASES